MLKRYVEVIREGVGSYTQPIEEAGSAIDAEFDGSEPGDKITMALVEMEEEEYKKLPEFQGW